LLPAVGISLGVAICLFIAGIMTAWLLPARELLRHDWNGGEPTTPAALQNPEVMIPAAIPDAGTPPEPPSPPDVDGPPPAPLEAMAGISPEPDLQRVSGRDLGAPSAFAEPSLGANGLSRVSVPLTDTLAAAALQSDALAASVAPEAPVEESPIEASELPPRSLAVDAGAIPAEPVALNGMASEPARTEERSMEGPNPAPPPFAAGSEQGEPCGADVCPAGQVCCNASCGTCSAPGGTCSQVSCSMPRYPLSVSCGRNTCSVGEVCCNLSCGICAAPGATCSEEICD
jgi:hypothetical protein